MNFILWIIFGALAGWIASMIAGTNERQGAIGNIVVGILGSVVGGFIMQTVFNTNVEEGFNLWSLLVAVGGAVLLLFLWKLLTGRHK